MEEVCQDRDAATLEVVIKSVGPLTCSAVESLNVLHN